MSERIGAKRGKQYINYGREGSGFGGVETGFRPTVAKKQVFSDKYRRMRRVYLNHKKRNNALSPKMARALSTSLQASEGLEFAMCTILRSRDDADTGPLFCPGMDLIGLYPEIAKGNHKEVHIWLQEMYNVVYRTTQLKTLLIPFMSGFAAGCGAGLVMHAPLSVASGESRLSFREARLGYSIDSGASFVLSRLDGELGLYLALTGHELQGYDLARAGIVNHYMQHHHFNMFALAAEDLNGGTFEVRNLLEHAYAASIAAIKIQQLPEWNLAPHLDAIDRCFAFDSLEEIQAALKKEGGDWADRTLKQLSWASPLALQLTIRVLREAASKDLPTCMHTEFNVGQHLLRTSDCRKALSRYLLSKQAPYFPPQPPTPDADKIYYTHNSWEEAQTGYARLPVNVSWGGLCRYPLTPMAWTKQGLSSSELDSYFAPVQIDGKAAPLRLYRRDDGMVSYTTGSVSYMPQGAFDSYHRRL
eukprot:gb/GEZN01005395.1/.p1 GENE.gb/GEZN01005395.1/~~gb/GEZN01005395.1/.p1  ORF type:complete len:503 (-),score=53.48 gb/GEZN01005395.1/:303-1724(-)